MVKTRTCSSYTVVFHSKTKADVFLASDPTGSSRVAKNYKRRRYDAWEAVLNALREEGRRDVYVGAGVLSVGSEEGMLPTELLDISRDFEHSFFEWVSVCKPNMFKVDHPIIWLDAEVSDLRDICRDIHQDDDRLGSSLAHRLEAKVRWEILDKVLFLIRNEFDRDQPLAVVDEELVFFRDTILPSDDQVILAIQQDTIDLVRQIARIGQERWS